VTVRRIVAHLAAADLTASRESRTIRGTAVPWDVDGVVSGGVRVRFTAGSVAPPDGDRPVPVLLHHDPSRPVGVVASAVPTDTGLDVVIRISATRDGDDALALAADGALGGLSVGVDADAVDESVTDAVVVTAAVWRELSLVTEPAFDPARISDVAATAARFTPEGTPEMDDLSLSLGDSVTVTAVDGTPDESDTTAAAPVDAAAPGAAIVAAAPRRARTAPDLSLRGVGAVLAATRGDAAQVRAALANVTTTDLAGLQRPQYLDEIAGLIKVGSPVCNAFRQGTITGSPVKYPAWETLPGVDVQAAEKTQVTSDDVSLVWKDAPVTTYAGGNDLSVQVIDWSSPDAIAAYLEACAEVWARKTDARFTADIVAAATPAVGSADLVADLFGMFGTVAATGLMPDRVVVSADQWGVLGAALAKDGPGLFGLVSPGFPVPQVVVAPFAPAGTFIVGSSQAARSFTNAGAPVTVRAVDVSLMGVDLGVYGYFADDVTYPDAIVKRTVAPARSAK
jgi:HK97 family phage prohead protease